MKRGAALALWAISLLAVALFAFVLGRSTAPASHMGETFYATVDRAAGDSLAVTGLEINDVNHRGAFTFSVEEDTVLEWRHAPIALAELGPGGTISVTYTGGIQESYPAGIDGVVRVQLLDDEK